MNVQVQIYFSLKTITNIEDSMKVHIPTISFFICRIKVKNISSVNDGVTTVPHTAKSAHLRQVWEASAHVNSLKYLN